MRNKVTYEWCIEKVDQYGDIQDQEYAGNLSELDLSAKPEGEIARHDLCLVRDVGNEEDGLVERSYAYIKDGEFTTGFREFPEQQDQHDVPARYKKEL